MSNEIYELEVHSYGGLTIYKLDDFTEKIELIKSDTLTEYKITSKDGHYVIFRGCFNYIERVREVNND